VIVAGNLCSCVQVVGTPDDGSELSSAFNVHPTSGAITLTKPILDFEYQRMYSLTIVVLDHVRVACYACSRECCALTISAPLGLIWSCFSVVRVQHLPQLSVTIVAIVNVVDVNERPVLTPSRVLLSENSPVGTLVGYPILVRDQDVDRAGSTQTIEFSIGLLADGSTPPFTIDAASGQISVSASVLNFEVTPLYNLTVIATDNGSPVLAANTTVVVLLRYVCRFVMLSVFLLLVQE
jgi:hypothetical protein